MRPRDVLVAALSEAGYPPTWVEEMRVREDWANIATHAQTASDAPLYPARLYATLASLHKL
jgi:hypothetical protein